MSETLSNATGETTSNVKRGIVRRGRGNHFDVTTFRIRPVEIGHEMPEVGGPVFKTGRASADVGLSASATRTVAAVVRSNDDGSKDAVRTRGERGDAVLDAARVWAAHRGCKRVWDIDIAAAIGFPWTPEGAAGFRKQYGITKVSTPWPTKVEETPDPAFAGPVVDPASGRDA